MYSECLVLPWTPCRTSLEALLEPGETRAIQVIAGALLNSGRYVSAYTFQPPRIKVYGGGSSH